MIRRKMPDEPACKWRNASTNQISLRNQTFYTEAYFDGEKRVAYAWLQFMRFCFKLI